MALARALVLEPEVLLLDEPFAGLDEPSRAALLPDVGAILRHDRVTTFLVTHDRGEAQALADRVAVLMAGRIVQLDATARDLPGAGLRGGRAVRGRRDARDRPGDRAGRRA